jgi:exodeoxyribonuclease VII large subunit
MLKDTDDAISVSQLNKLAKTLLEHNMPVFWIKGEISGLKTYNHVYFDLKDEGAKISCVVFAKVVSAVDFKLENGQQIEVRGRVTIYPANGSYQINVERVRRVGIGQLWEAYHRLLTKLKAEGLFEPHYKKTIPLFPTTIGVITSKEGSVIRDVVTTLKRRMPCVPIVIYHTLVQGADASMQISRAIRIANLRQEVDVLIVCRGGGSMEDLWCFNEEVVAREVFASTIPIISAIGHETDTTIIDFVSDLRAPTPTGAAELVARSKAEWLDLLHKLHYQLQGNLDDILNAKRQLLDAYYTKLKLLNPLNRINNQVNALKLSQLRLKQAVTQLIIQNKNRLLLNASKLESYQLDAAKYYTQLKLVSQKLNMAVLHMLTRNKNILQLVLSKLDTRHLDLSVHQSHLANLDRRLKLSMSRVYGIKHSRLSSVSKHLELVNPTNILSRGYAIVTNTKGEIVYSSKNVENHEQIEIKLATDNITAIINKTKVAKKTTKVTTQQQLDLD